MDKYLTMNNLNTVILNLASFFQMQQESIPDKIDEERNKYIQLYM